MFRRTVSVVVLALLLTSMLALSFSIRPARGSGTIYIRANGSVDPSTAAISTLDNVTYTFTGNISDSIAIERDSIVVDGKGYMIQGPGSGNGIDMSGRSNVTIRDMEIKLFSTGILLDHSSSNSISGNNIIENSVGICLFQYSLNNTVSEDNMTNNGCGIWLNQSSNSGIVGNNVANNGQGIVLAYSSNNNSIVGNSVTANDEHGIWQVDSLGNNISENNITASYYIGVEFLSSTDSSISWNNITGSDYGICLYGSLRNSIRGNNVTRNHGGIVLEYSSNDNRIIGNNVTNNRWHGFDVYSSSNNTLAMNMISGNPRNFGVRGRFLGDFMNSIDTSNLVNEKPVLYLVNQTGILINPETFPEVGFLGLVNCINMTIERLNLTGNMNGLLMAYTHNSKIRANDIVDNDYGVDMIYSSGNTFFHNNFIKKFPWNYNIYKEYGGTSNVWDNGYPSGGNYWDDYRGPDLLSGPFQNETGGDGIGDEPCPVYADNSDHYPLMEPYAGLHEVSVKASISKTVVAQGYYAAVTMNITVKNRGVNTETFNFTFRLSTIIEQKSTLTLQGRNSTTITYTWNTTGCVCGNYTVNAVADTVTGETDTADNTYHSWIILTAPGDVNGDYIVDIYDAIKLAGAFGSTLGDLDWDPNADINGDDIVDIYDAILLASNYGKTS